MVVITSISKLDIKSENIVNIYDLVEIVDQEMKY